MSGQILTIAGAMFLIPLLIMVAFALVTDVPGPLLFFGGWNMAFSLIVGAIGVFMVPFACRGWPVRWKL